MSTNGATRPKISVVLPVRNGEPYIRATLESILSQRYPHFDIWLLENHSRDATVAIAESFHDARLHILPAESPLSIEQNWQRILSVPLAEYVTLIGHDDLFYPDFLDEIAALIERHPQATLFRTHFHFIDAQGAIVRNCKPIPAQQTGDQFLQARQRYELDMYGTGFVMRSVDYIRVGGLPPLPFLYYADELAFYKLASLGGFVCSAQYLFGYRYHRRSASFDIDLETLYEASSQYLRILTGTAYYDGQGHRELAIAYVEKTFNRRYHRLLLDLVKKSDAVSVAAYKAAKGRLFTRARADQMFKVYDLSSWMIERLLNLPPAVRKALSEGVEVVARLTRSFRK